MKPKARKYRIRRNTEDRMPAAGQQVGAIVDTEDGFGTAPFPGSAAAEHRSAEVEAGIAAVRREGLTGRQLRMARRLAQKHGLVPTSDFDAVRLLRERGIDPFDRAQLIELVSSADAAPTTAAPRPKTERADAPKVRTNLPQTVPDERPKLPGEPIDPDRSMGLHEVERIQRDIVARRRRKVILLCIRLAAFILLPTLVAYWYFSQVATPSYATTSEFVVQEAESQSIGGGGGLLGGTSLATSQDSIMVQDYLTSREALLRLDRDHGYREHFSAPFIDSLQRVPEGATNEALFSHFNDNVKVGYDPTEGILRMEVSALSPDMSRVFSEALIGYAEERVDAVTERKRADQMRGARDVFDEAEANMRDAQKRVLELQTQLGILDPLSESTAIMTRISAFETELSEKELKLQQLLDNDRPNEARVAGVRGDIKRLNTLVAELRSELTTETTARESLANITAQLQMAETDLETRTMMMQEALQQMEVSRTEANRQVRFLSVGVAPIPPDEPTYPRAFENTMITLIIFSGIYLLASITIGVLREQISN